jgi:hypothetical protein
MFTGPLHNRGVDDRCEACGEPFPCPTGIAIFEAVKRELEHSTPPPTPEPAPAPIEQPPRPRWEDLEDREYRCPKCLHWWVAHGTPGEDDYGCGISMRHIYEVLRLHLRRGQPRHPPPGTHVLSHTTLGTRTQLTSRTHVL